MQLRGKSSILPLTHNIHRCRLASLELKCSLISAQKLCLLTLNITYPRLLRKLERRQRTLRTDLETSALLFLRALLTRCSLCGTWSLMLLPFTKTPSAVSLIRAEQALKVSHKMPRKNCQVELRSNFISMASTSSLIISMPLASILMVTSKRPLCFTKVIPFQVSPQLMCLFTLSSHSLRNWENQLLIYFRTSITCLSKCAKVLLTKFSSDSPPWSPRLWTSSSMCCRKNARKLE